MPVAGYTPGSLGGWLSDVQLIGLVGKYYEKYLSRFPLLELFVSRTRHSREFMVDTLINLLITGGFTHRPAAGQRVDPIMMKRVAASTFFASYIVDLDDDQLLGLLEPGSMTSLGDIDRLNTAVTKLKGDISNRVLIYLRSLHLHVSKILSTQGSVDLTFTDGAVLPVNWGFGTDIYSADWDTSTTNIVTDWGRMVRQFKKSNNGLKPNTIVVHDRFHERFVSGNDELRQDFAVRNPDVMKPFLDSLGIASSSRDDINGVKVILMADAYIDESSTPAIGEDSELVDVWPENIATFCYIDHEEENFLMNTVRTISNDFKGGLGTTTFPTHNPEAIHISITANAVPSFAVPQRVQINKLSATVTKAY